VRSSSAQLAQVLQGSFQTRFWADVYYDGTRVLEDAPLTECAPSFSDSGDVEGSAEATIVYSSSIGESFSPTEVSDLFAPFGTKVAIYVEIFVGNEFSERVLVGFFRITSVPQSYDMDVPFLGRSITINSSIQLSLQDSMIGIIRDKFTRPALPLPGNGVYEELKRLSNGMSITRSVPDAGIPISAVVYDESRMKAVQELAELLDAKPYILPNDTLGVRSKTPGEVVTRLTLGEYGTVSDLGNAMDSEDVYNGVYIVGENDKNETVVLAERWIYGGPLRCVNGDGSASPMGRVPYKYKSDRVTTVAQAEAMIDALLVRVSSVRSVVVPVTCVLDPRLELGDVVEVEKDNKIVKGRIKNISYGAGSTMNLSMEVLEVSNK